MSEEYESDWQPATHQMTEVAYVDRLKALADLVPELVEALENAIRVADSYSQLKWTDAEISAISNNRTTLDKAQRLLEEVSDEQKCIHCDVGIQKIKDYLPPFEDSYQTCRICGGNYKGASE